MYNKGGVIEFKIKHRYIQNFHILKNMFVNIILVVVFSNFLISLFFSNIKITIYQCYNVDLKQISSFSIIAEMSKASELSALSVDGSFNFGKFEVTPFTYRHPNIECKSKNIPEASHNMPATIIVPTLIQAYKKQETYVSGFFKLLHANVLLKTTNYQ